MCVKVSQSVSFRSWGRLRRRGSGSRAGEGGDPPCARGRRFPLRGNDGGLRTGEEGEGAWRGVGGHKGKGGFETRPYAGPPRDGEGGDSRLRGNDGCCAARRGRPSASGESSLYICVSKCAKSVTFRMCGSRAAEGGLRQERVTPRDRGAVRGIIARMFAGSRGRRPSAQPGGGPPICIFPPQSRGKREKKGDGGPLLASRGRKIPRRRGEEGLRRSSIYRMSGQGLGGTLKRIVSRAISWLRSPTRTTVTS